MKDTDRRHTTTDAGIPVPSDEFSLTVGPDGPILLQDHYLMEQMANFNREMIPDRQPHAKGSGAFGYFEVTQDVSAYTKRKDEDDFGQPGTLVRKVMDDAQRDRLVFNVVGALKGASEPVLKRAFEYWRNIDKEIGDRIAKGVNSG
jgi:catalase